MYFKESPNCGNQELSQEPSVQHAGIYPSACIYVPCPQTLTQCGSAGVYEIVSRDARKTSFAYKLEIPQEPGEVQKELQIKKEASYTLSMKVPYCFTSPTA